MALFGIGDVDNARAFLKRTLEARGAIVGSLPPRFEHVQSPHVQSSHVQSPHLQSSDGPYAFVDGVFALELVADRGLSGQWLAVSCVRDPGSPTRERGGAAVARRVELSGLAIDRFQQCCGGDPDVVVAAGQLRNLLERTARTLARPPAWWRAEPADLLLTAGEREEYLIPCRRRSGGFTAMTVVVRGGDLFDLDARGLLGRCRIDDAAMPVGSVAARLFDRLMRSQVRLERARPRWAPPTPEATWWIVAVPETRRIAAAVVWQPGNRRPLCVRGVVDARPWLLRFAAMLRHRLELRPAERF
jgi:hypothetical protein